MASDGISYGLMSQKCDAKELSEVHEPSPDWRLGPGVDSSRFQ